MSELKIREGITNEKYIKYCYRGDVFYADLGDGVGSEQKWIRPVLVIQNDVGNKYSPTVIIAAITSKTGKAKMPTHVELKNILREDSLILLEQIRTIDKSRLKEKIGCLNEELMNKVDKALLASIGIGDIYKKNNEVKMNVIDFEKIKKLGARINGLEKFIVSHSDCINELTNYFSSIKSLKGELKSYCKTNGLDYNLYYQPIEGMEELYYGRRAYCI